jgi:hypothetical protein
MSANTSVTSATSATSATTDDKYIILGLDFTNFLGTGIDLSGIIDTIGGALNFEIASILCCVLCIISIILLVVTSGTTTKKHKGLKIPGIGTLSPQQPLVIEMPMQNAPYPFNDSPFPKDS